MVTIRSTAAALLLLVAVPTSALSSSAPPILTSTLSGIVRDDLGRALEGVEVLVLSSQRSTGGIVLRVMSDAGGRFVIGAIAPGVYRVAAIKTGYIAALGNVNTLLRSSVDLVLRPVPKAGQPGAEKVLEDLSWTLRVPPRSVLRELDPGASLASHSTGGARAFAARVQDSVRGEVDHVIAMGSWRSASSGPSSNLAGNETRMRVAGTLGERGAIQVQGRRGTLDSSSAESPTAVRRGASKVNLDVSYDTSVDASLAMRAFYSAGDLSVDDRVGMVGGAARQSQRSWGYDARWRKQVDASSRVALQVGFQDASLEAGREIVGVWDPDGGGGENRAIGAEGSYENLAGESHLVRLGVRAKRLTSQAPAVRLGRDSGRFSLDGAAGWSLLVDTEDQWSVAAPVVVTYGLTVRQGFDGSDATRLVPRVGASWRASRIEARASVSYLTAHRATGMQVDSRVDASRSPFGYDAALTTRLDRSTTLTATTSYVPSRADVWGSEGIVPDAEVLFVSDGFASDRFVAVELERVASPATVYLRLARGRAEGALAPALDDALPVVLLSDRALDYDSARFGLKAPRAGSAFALEYRAIDDHAASLGGSGAGALRSIEMEFAQELVRFGGGRATCRLLLTARSALGPGSVVTESDPADARRFAAEHKRVGAGVSLAF